MIENPIWANVNYSKDPGHVLLVREFMAWDVLRAEPYRIVYDGNSVRWGFNEGFNPIIAHWSRIFEYPWAIRTACLTKEDVVLDAGGGDGLIQYAAAYRAKHVTNMDRSDKHAESFNNGILHSHMKNLVFEKQDLRKIGYPKDWFDKVFCISTLEHTDAPEEILERLLEVLKPGGRLVATMDIVEHPHEQFCFDEFRARKFLSRLGLSYPEKHDKVLIGHVPDKEEKSGTMRVDVLCFFYDKPRNDYLAAWGKE